MLPQRQKVDISSFSEQERVLFEKYGKVPSHKSLLSNKMKERKYFDSGDYALSKAGVEPQHIVGKAIPSPQDIPHASPPNTTSGISTSPSNTNQGSSLTSFGSDAPTGANPPNFANTFGSPGKEPIGQAVPQ